MEDILDDFEINEPKREKLFSIISFINGIAIWILAFYLVYQVSDELSAEEYLYEYNPDVIYLIRGLIISGIFFSALSFLKKEQNTFWKIAGAVLNGLVVILVAGAMLLILCIDFF